MEKKVAIIATDYFEEDELFSPLRALREAGAEVDILAPHSGEIKGLRHVDPGKSAPVTIALDQADPAQYDAVVVPGGVVNADHLRVDESAKTFLRAMFTANKPTAVICHGPWLLVSADLVRGRKLTSYHTIQDDIRNAGGSWFDEEVVVDGNLITSRKPADLPAFNHTLLSALQQ